MATYQDLCDHMFSYAILATRILGVHPKEFLIFGFDLWSFPLGAWEICVSIDHVFIQQSSSSHG